MVSNYNIQYQIMNNASIYGILATKKCITLNLSSLSSYIHQLASPS